jgi:hypothetical protein
MTFWQQLLISLFGGLVGGGLIVSWIELKRFTRERNQWTEEDKKMLIHVNSALYSIRHWDAKNISEEDEKIRVFESGLNGNISSWKYFLKFGLENLSKRDLLVNKIDLNFSNPTRIKVTQEDRKYFRKYHFLISRIYDMFNKSLIHDRNFPLLIPANSTMGIVIIGINDFDYPDIVTEVPTMGIITIALNGGFYLQKEICFTDKNFIFDIDTSTVTGEYHWTPYLEFINEYEELPF